jgi:lipopolysaccharide/colanic/teichoic acid biosynthesis glycosyltransferase
MLESQVALYPGSAYYRLRPGVTGFWQISDRNECDFSDRARFDEDYDRELSFGTDVRVIAATVGVVLRGTGY